MSQERYDVCIIGGGLVGRALALMLAGLSLKVVVVEQQPLRERQNPDESKALALTYATQQLLVKLGVWPRLTMVASPIAKVHVSERGKFGRCLLEADSLNLPALGYLVPEAYLSQALVESVAEQSLASMLQPAHIDSLDHPAREVRVKQADDLIATISYRLLIAADGASSLTRQSLGVSITEKHYQQSALVTRVTISQPHHQVAYERFTPKGTLALLPVSKARCALIISGDNHVIKTWHGFSDQVFLEKLQADFGFRLGRFSTVSQRIIFPLTSVLADQQVGEGFLIMGNAAHLIHPVAAQGFNLSMLDLAALEEILGKALASHEAIDALPVLQLYQQWREQEQQIVIKVTDRIVSLFSSELLGMQYARHLGLIGLEYLSPLKALLTKRAVGLGGRIARLLRV